MEATMPVFSKRRGVQLLTKEECASTLQVSVSTVKRALKKPGVYTELHSVNRTNARGAKRVLYIDPFTLGIGAVTDLLNPDLPKSSQGQVQKVNDVSQAHAYPAPSGRKKQLKQIDQEPTSEAHPTLNLRSINNLQLTQHRFNLIHFLIRLDSHERAKAVQELAAQEGVSRRTVYRWIKKSSTTKA